ncbi:alpha/beta hydrolase-fold protein [Idiomarina sp.]|uniref:alpha/beta hydrolase-fold protein n=1 Tax=Idiomarina sp. TaxID=1874361 RepID=UPI001E03A367|nr:alpha/beta hydrolase-fold protein [Idiomarina sp.]MCJ8317504.1 alpha/beta hydrolase-fold protein [Idiomarina sp.]NQZ17117.1 alpha/beta hydrolase [Idiomarina sp.]
MPIYLKALSFLCVFLFCTSTQAAETFRVDSKLINETATTRVVLPESYHHSDSFEYPIMLVMDGSTQFEHIAGNVNFLSTFSIVPEIIVVGVSAKSRIKHFTHTELEGYEGRSGGAQLYTRFLQDELLPELKKQYRVSPYTLVTGHSLSGLYTSYLATHHADFINASISVSPSLWWDDFALINDIKAAKQQAEKSPVRWFVSMANEPNEMADGYQRLMNVLAEKSESVFDWESQQFPEETHDSTPLIANVEGLKSIFRGYNAVPNIEIKSLEQLQAYYGNYQKTMGYKFPMSVHQYNVYGLKAAYEGELEWGIEILEKGVEVFGQSEILWNSLATVYSMNGDSESARQASNKALKLARQHQSKYLSEIEAQNGELTMD